MLKRCIDPRKTRNLLRIYQCSVRHHNFDGEAYSKTNLNLLTKEDDGHTYIEAFSPVGFVLSSGLRVLGPCALFPKSVLHWNVASAKKVSPDSLSLFTMLEPKPDILIIGIGNRGAAYDKNIIKYLRSKCINVEILPTEQACSTFNFLNSERRVVAAALIPPAEVEASGDDMMVTDIMESMHSTETEDRDPFTSKVTKTMETFKSKGLISTIGNKDRLREKRDLNEKHENNKDGNSSNS